ncbi:MAG: nucleotide exchange factor GrpE [Firmicutes bacterium]|nr:nucleotide exchange factor GrpE [Bacillota bacterium]
MDEENEEEFDESEQYNEEENENDRVVELSQQLLRMAADFDNYKKRERENLKRHILDAKIEVIEKILPLVDILNKAVAMTQDKNTKSGLEMISKQFSLNLESLGVVSIKALGEEFNPNYHNAVMDEEVANEKKVGTILEVFTEGYMIGDRVLRYADVKIGK